MMMTSHFSNPTDKYFVTTVLRACLILIVATFFAHLASLVIMSSWFYLRFAGLFPHAEKMVESIAAFPLVDLGIYSIALFIAGPEFDDWQEIITVLLIFATLRYWIRFLNGPIRNLHKFAKFHQVKPTYINSVLGPFYLSAYVDYYFIVLKRTLLPLVFVLVVMDFRILLPRLVESGMSITAFIMFISLMVSLHLLTVNKGQEK